MELLLLSIYLCFYNLLQYLHSNMELLLPPSFQFILSLNSLFTFQYGATATESLVSIFIKVKLFTFQYGATATLTLPYKIVYSLIFTFQYGATATLSNYQFLYHIFLIYIPIWSYCYFFKDGIVKFKVIFTFQYGATATREN